MSSRRKRPQALDVTVQFATRRTGVPHATSFATWANVAFDAARSRRPVSMPLTIRIVGAAESRVLNRTWRGKDKPTNVLSFPNEGSGLGTRGSGKTRKSTISNLARTPNADSYPEELGDLAICASVVAREAREQGKNPRAHWAHMVVHGVLHLLGYDHENDRDADDMESREVTILARFGYANPYG